MWTCRKCRETIEDTFQVCWKCGTSKEGVEDPEYRSDPDSGDARARANPVACPRCDRTLEYVGTRRFHEGPNWGILGELGEIFVKRERFDVYVCQRCGRVEFFVDGIGEAFRPR